MSSQTRSLDHWITTERVLGLEWPGVNMEECELVSWGTITGVTGVRSVDRTIEYERREIIERVPYYTIGVLPLAGVEFYPPDEGEEALGIQQDFWHIRHPESNRMAILRNPF